MEQGSYKWILARSRKVKQLFVQSNI